MRMMWYKKRTAMCMKKVSLGCKAKSLTKEVCGKLIKKTCFRRRYVTIRRRFNPCKPWAMKACKGDKKCYVGKLRWCMNMRKNPCVKKVAADCKAKKVEKKECWANIKKACYAKKEKEEELFLF